MNFHAKTTIKIEKSVPMPRGRTNRYPWHDMEVGDSFQFPPTQPAVNFHTNAAAATRRYAPKKFVARKVGDGTYRCWRTA